MFSLLVISDVNIHACTYVETMYVEIHVQTYIILCYTMSLCAGWPLPGKTQVMVQLL